jgi:hypothetical protein
VLICTVQQAASQARPERSELRAGWHPLPATRRRDIWQIWSRRLPLPSRTRPAWRTARATQGPSVALPCSRSSASASSEKTPTCLSAGFPCFAWESDRALASPLFSFLSPLESSSLYRYPIKVQKAQRLRAHHALTFKANYKAPRL